MKLLIFLLGIEIIFLSSLAFSQEIYTLNLSIQGEPKATLDLKEFLQDNPEIELPKSGTEYHIGIVEPDSSIDYKILNVEIDSNVKYKLRIINPESVNETSSIHDELVDELLRKYKQGRNGNKTK